MKQSIINTTNEYHVLRHFLNVSDKYNEQLIGKEYLFYNQNKSCIQKEVITQVSIEEALNTTGSKFFENISNFEISRR